jgi:D-sedoheptulose 7-phosphate isomerase
VNYINELKQYIEEEKEVIQSLNLDDVNTVMNVLEETRKKNGRIYICGNGGSAATASHFVCDFNKGVGCVCKDKYQFICLNDNIPSMLAISNDISYDEVFSYQINGVITANDIFIGISGSGNSKNVVKAIEVADKVGAKTIAICGYSGGKIKDLANYHVHVNSNNMQFCEDLHMMLDHMMMYVLYNNLKINQESKYV